MRFLLEKSSGTEFDLGRHSLFLDDIERLMERTSRDVMEHQCYNRLKKTFLGLAPRDTSSEVLRIAIDLSKQHACNEGCRLVGLVIRSESKKRLDEFFSQRKKNSGLAAGGDVSLRSSNFHLTSTNNSLPTIQKLHSRLERVIAAKSNLKTNAFFNLVFEKNNFQVLAKQNIGTTEFSAILNFALQENVVSKGTLIAMGNAVGVVIDM